MVKFNITSTLSLIDYLSLSTLKQWCCLPPHLLKAIAESVPAYITAVVICAGKTPTVLFCTAIAYNPNRSFKPYNKTLPTYKERICSRSYVFQSTSRQVLQPG